MNKFEKTMRKKMQGNLKLLIENELYKRKKV